MILWQRNGVAASPRLASRGAVNARAWEFISINSNIAAGSRSVIKRDNAAKSWIVARNSEAKNVCHGRDTARPAGLNFSMIAASIDGSLQRVSPC